MAEEQIILVDQHDKQIGSAEKLQVHKDGELHRAFSVFIFRKTNDQIELLLQKRKKDKYHSGGLWTNTCCSHPRDGEEIIAGAQRRLEEEMGIKAELKTAGSFHYKAEFENGLVENEFDHVLVGHVNIDTIQFNEDEVEDYCWMSVSEVEKDLEATPEEFTQWFKEAFSIAVSSF